MVNFVVLRKEPLSPEHGVLVRLWVGCSIVLVSGLMHACWIIGTHPAEQLSCYFERDAGRVLDISIMRCR